MAARSSLVSGRIQATTLPSRCMICNHPSLLVVCAVQVPASRSTAGPASSTGASRSRGHAVFGQRCWLPTRSRVAAGGSSRAASPPPGAPRCGHDCMIATRASSSILPPLGARAPKRPYGSRFAAHVGTHGCMQYPAGFRSRIHGRMDDDNRTANLPPGRRAGAASGPARLDPLSRGGWAYPEHWLILLLLVLSYAGAIWALMG